MERHEGNRLILAFMELPVQKNWEPPYHEEMNLLWPVCKRIVGILERMSDATTTPGRLLFSMREAGAMFDESRLWEHIVHAITYINGEKEGKFENSCEYNDQLATSTEVSVPV